MRLFRSICIQINGLLSIRLTPVQSIAGFFCLGATLAAKISCVALVSYGLKPLEWARCSGAGRAGPFGWKSGDDQGDGKQWCEEEVEEDPAAPPEPTSEAALPPLQWMRQLRQ